MSCKHKIKQVDRFLGNRMTHVLGHYHPGSPIEVPPRGQRDRLNIIETKRDELAHLLDNV